MIKKILLITFEYPIGKKYCGGVGQMVERSRQTLLDLDYEVYVLISGEFQKKSPIQLLLPDNRVLRYPNFYAFQKKHPLKHFDLIIQHFVNWTRDLRRLKTKKRQQTKIVYHFHSILRREKDSGFKTFNKFLLNQEKMIEMADHIICPSRYEYDNFNRYFPNFSDKLSLIENMVDVFPPDKKAVRNFKNRYGITAKDIVSIFVGRIERAKGAHILIKNLPQILNRRRHLKFFIIGKVLEPNLQRKLRHILKHYPRQVFYIKYLEKRQLFQLYHLSHIYINSSLSESFSLSTYEGAFCKNALLLNRLPVFERFKAGAVFFSPYNPNGDGFVHKYSDLIRNRALRRRLAQKAHQATNRFLAHRNLAGDFRHFLENLG